jgi:hypothetical protein
MYNVIFSSIFTDCRPRQPKKGLSACLLTEHPQRPTHQEAHLPMTPLKPRQSSRVLEYREDVPVSARPPASDDATSNPRHGQLQAATGGRNTQE